MTLTNSMKDVSDEGDADGDEIAKSEYVMHMEAGSLENRIKCIEHSLRYIEKSPDRKHHADGILKAIGVLSSSDDASVRMSATACLIDVLKCRHNLGDDDIIADIMASSNDRLMSRKTHMVRSFKASPSFKLSGKYELDWEEALHLACPVQDTQN